MISDAATPPCGDARRGIGSPKSGVEFEKFAHPEFLDFRRSDLIDNLLDGDLRKLAHMAARRTRNPLAELLEHEFKQLLIRMLPAADEIHQRLTIGG